MRNKASALLRVSNALIRHSNRFSLFCIAPHTFEEIASKDKIKHEKLQGMGISVLRFWDEDVIKNIEGVLGVIHDFIRRFEG